jgi:hypothetical protein
MSLTDVAKWGYKRTKKIKRQNKKKKRETAVMV